MGKFCSFIEKQVLHDDAFHRTECRLYVLGVGVGLRDILTLDVKPP